MSESKLRNRIHFLGYGLLLLFAGTLAARNLRFGLYELFFAALVLGVMAIMGLGLTWLQRRTQWKHHVHSVLLGVMSILVVAVGSLEPLAAVQWAYPLQLLILLMLPLRSALLICAGLTLACGVMLMSAADLSDTLSHLFAMLILLGLGTLYAHRYHHHVQSVAELTILDSVTGAYNLRYFEETLRKEISRSEVSTHPLSLMQLSIDFFEELRELHDNAALNTLLLAVSQKLGQTIRAGDSHYYAGEGHFYLLMPFTPEEGMHVIAERLRRLIEETRWPGPESLTASIGCTTRQTGETSPDVLRMRVSKALDEARQRGHNKVRHLRAHPE